MKCPAFSADRPDHLILFRTYVSRQAAKIGRAVLEGVGLDSGTIKACFSNFSEEEAVQDGLIRWKDGQGTQPPTWCVLLDAMEYAYIAQEHVQGLKRKLGLLGMLYSMEHCVYMRACMRVCVCMCTQVRCTVHIVLCLYINYMLVVSGAHLNNVWNRVMAFLWSPPTPPTPSHFTYTLHTCLHSL